MKSCFTLKKCNTNIGNTCIIDFHILQGRSLLKYLFYALKKKVKIIMNSYCNGHNNIFLSYPENLLQKSLELDSKEVQSVTLPDEGGRGAECIGTEDEEENFLDYTDFDPLLEECTDIVSDGEKSREDFVHLQTENETKSKEQENECSDKVEDSANVQKSSMEDQCSFTPRRSSRKRKGKYGLNSSECIESENEEYLHQPAKSRVGNEKKRENIKEDSSKDIKGVKSNHLDSHSRELACVFCDRYMKNLNGLLRHVVSHAGKKLLCKICNKKCNTAVDLKKHVESHQNEELLLKGGNSAELDGLGSLKHSPKHQIMGCADGGTEGSSKTCNLCQVEMSSYSSLRRHMDCHKNLEIFKCYVCSKNFRTKQELSSHAASHQMSLVNSCKVCEKLFMSEKELQFHMETSCGTHLNAQEIHIFESLKNHESNKEKEFSASDELVQDTNTDARIDSEICIKAKDKTLTIPEINWKTDKVSKPAAKCYKKGLVCELCGQTFRKAINLYRHKMEHDENGTFSCQFCKFTTKNRENLTRHSKKHLAQLPHVCETCGRGFTEKCNLTAHIQSHAKEKQFLCDDCGKSYQTRQSLLVHKRIHLGTKPYKCRYCEQRFTAAGYRREHEKIHLNKRSYMCDSCGKTFNQRCGLFTHKATHHNPSPSHVCSTCGKAFKTPNSLRSHFISKHLKPEDVASYGFRVYTCEVCQKLFSDKSELRIHMNKHTGL